MQNRISFSQLMVFLASVGIHAAAWTQVALVSDTIEIVSSGESRANIDGAFSSFLTPSVNSVGTVVFNARLFNTSDGNLNNSGIYRFRIPAGDGLVGVALEEVAREGASFSASGNNYELNDVFLSAFRLEDAPIPQGPASGLFSKLALQLPVRSGNPTGNSILVVESSPVTSSGATVNLVAAAGAQVPSGNGFFREFNSFSMSDITSAGEVNFFSALNLTANGSADDTALFRYQAGGSIVELVRESEPASGGGLFTAIGGIRSNDFGGVVFSGTNDSGNPATDTALYRVTSNGLTANRLIGEGDSAPSSEPDPRIFAQLSEVRINNNDVVGFAGVLRDTNGIAVQNDSGLYTTNGVSVTEIVHAGQLTPNGDATFGRFASTISGDIPRSPFNDLGQFAFTVDLVSVGSNDQISGVFRASATEIIEIAQQGDGYEDGTLFNFQDPALNNHGLVAFQADLNLGTASGPEGSLPISEGLLVVTDGQDYATVAREGQVINNKTILELFFNNDPTGPANGFSDAGIVAYEVLYTDGSSAINYWRPQLGWRAAAGDGLWDDEANWFFNMQPNFASDIAIDGTADVTVQGPSAETQVNSLSIGNGSGSVQLVAGAGSIATNNGINIGGNGLLQVTDNNNFHALGAVHNNGEIEIGQNGQLLVEGLFTGDGLISGVNGTIIFDGQLSPGNSPGLLVSEGNAILTDNNETILEIAGLARGSEFDGIDVGGTLTLDGTLSIVLLEGFELQVGHSFLLLQAGNILGAFDLVNLPTVAGLQLVLELTQTSLSLNVQPVPLPAAVWMFAGALFVLMTKRRREKLV